MVTVLMLATMLAQPAPAKTTIEFHLLPPGHELVLEDGKKVRYYLLHEWLELAAADLQLRKLKEEVELKDKLVLDLEVKVKAKDTQITELTGNLQACDGQSARRLGKYQQCEKDLVDAQSGPIWPYVVGAAGAIVGIVGATLAIAD